MQVIVVADVAWTENIGPETYVLLKGFSACGKAFLIRGSGVVGNTIGNAGWRQRTSETRQKCNRILFVYHTYILSHSRDKTLTFSWSYFGVVSMKTAYIPRTKWLKGDKMRTIPGIRYLIYRARVVRI